MRRVACFWVLVYWVLSARVGHIEDERVERCENEIFSDWAIYYVLVKQLNHCKTAKQLKLGSVQLNVSSLKILS